ncbi:HDOD domain-containing protein [Desulfolithobacter sp.]
MDTAEKLINKFKKIKTLPHIVTRLAELINDPDSTLHDFEEVIRTDPALVARLLTLVNSSYYGLVRKVDSISRAVALLGMKNLHNIAVTDALNAMFSFTLDDVDGFSPSRLWLHCVGTAICSKMIAERIFSINGDDAYLCGILHDIGLLVESQVATEEFLKAYEAWDAETDSLVKEEKRLLGTDHGTIGYLLTRSWQLPEPLAEAVRNHHSVADDIPPRSLLGILQMSQYILSQLDLTVKPGETMHLPPSLTTHIQKNIEEYRVLAADLPEEVERIQKMYNL